MSDQQKIKARIEFEQLHTDKLIRQTVNPLREFEDEFIEGAIIDIGCGQSNFLLDYANTGRKIYAVDQEQYQLDFLKRRAEQIPGCQLSNWNFLNLTFPKDALPGDEYSVIILSNLLHFFTFEECQEIIPLIHALCQTGTLIYISVHSKAHYCNDPTRPDQYSTFKHYFSIEDLDLLFPKTHFEKIFHAEILKQDSETEKRIINLWIEEVLKAEEPDEKKRKKANYLKGMSQADIGVIYRKK